MPRTSGREKRIEGDQGNSKASWVEEYGVQGVDDQVVRLLDSVLGDFAIAVRIEERILNRTHDVFERAAASDR